MTFWRPDKYEIAYVDEDAFDDDLASFGSHAEGRIVAKIARLANPKSHAVTAGTGARSSAALMAPMPTASAACAVRTAPFVCRAQRRRSTTARTSRS